MTRKRLGAIDHDSVSEVRGAAERSAQERRGLALSKAPPIGQVAGTAARSIEEELLRLRHENKDLQHGAETWKEAQEAGLVLRLVPLDDIDIHALARDRRVLDREGEPWAELKASLAARGQQVPIELGDYNPSTGKYHLISGYRRVSALKELFAETGDERFAAVRAMVSRARDTVEAMVAMVEENEIRQEISFYERGRICCVAAEQGVCESVDAAIETLFPSSTRNRRYKIRNFTLIHSRLGAYLDYPEQIGERLGARLAQALKEGREGELTSVLSNRETKFSESTEELALLDAFVGRKGDFAVPKPAKPAALTAKYRADGVTLVGTMRNGRINLTVQGVPVGDEDALHMLLAKVAAAVAQD
ncbi:MAG: ParB/RepB/Spo0J family partition protein [Qingshengfaniella sp.]